MHRLVSPRTATRLPPDGSAFGYSVYLDNTIPALTIGIPGKTGIGAPASPWATPNRSAVNIEPAEVLPDVSPCETRPGSAQTIGLVGPISLLGGHLEAGP